MFGLERFNGNSTVCFAALGLVAALLAPGIAQAQAPCNRTITAKVVAIDQPIMYNRLGAQNINGMVFALRRDVIDKTTGLPEVAGGTLSAGNVQLRPDKRPRPLVLRVAEGDCLTVEFENLLATSANPSQQPFGLPAFKAPFANDQVADRFASFHAQGLQLVSTGGMANDGSLVGENPVSSSGIVGSGGTATYKLYAEKRGAYLIQSYGATFGSESLQGNSANGLFGAINVEPSSETATRLTKFYRSQLTEEEMRLAADPNGDGTIDATEKTPAGQPIIRYEQKYPSDCARGTDAPLVGGDGVWCKEGKAGLPILNMLTADNELVHSDLNAIIVGPNDGGKFDKTTYPLESKGLRNPALPNRLEPFREFTVIFHDEGAGAQVFPAWYADPVFGYVLEGVKDAFMINYGSGGVGSEIIANRLGVGPMHDCLACAYEEFFLTSYAVGDPSMVVDIPANFGLEALAPGEKPARTGPIATEAFYPDDPSNVHHSYMNDRTVFRNVHVGKEQHVFHLHNNQWLFNPDDDNSNYIDAQSIGPGSGYTYEINYGGSGNRNKSAGDAIFHCHFYPHFAQGMWELWRQHDVLETGTYLESTLNGTGLFHANPFGLLSGKPALADGIDALKASGSPGGARARALPDGEIAAGTPIPALVPLPGIAMPVMPGKVNVVPKTAGAVTLGSNAFVDRTETYAAGPGVATQLEGKLKNPGYPFWIASIEDTVGQRPATPPLDMLASAGGFDGGLPRHALDGIASAGPDSFDSTVSNRDFSKVVHKAAAVFFPESGTDVEKAVIDFHSLVRNHPSYAVNIGSTTPVGDVFFTTNGYRDPDINPCTGASCVDVTIGGASKKVYPVQPGSPYHEPCIDDAGKRLTTGVTGKFFGAVDLSVTGSSPFNATTPRVYKGANMQFDAILNKVGYHYPQQRITALWSDVVPTINKLKPPEPLVMRLNTFDCAMYYHTNLVPEFFEMDDFQVRTPTDIIGQHIHLPKWDLTTADGSANGWNYEDGTLSPGAVQERIRAINSLGLASSRVGTGSPTEFIAPRPLEAQTHLFFGPTGPGGKANNWLGARVTLQRWFADPVVNVQGEDRGLGIIFTHDHYSPSTHQQVGLYAAVLAEPAGSTWKHNETGVQLGCTSPTDAVCRADGGPTSWQAAIIPAGGAGSFREFYLEYSDFQHAYEKGVYVGATDKGAPAPGVVAPATLSAADSFRFAINPPARTQLLAPNVFPDLYHEVPGGVLPGCPERPCPQAISVQDPGVYVTNYRNEPVALRVFNPLRPGPDGILGSQTLGPAGDLGLALQSRNDRAIAELNKQPNFFKGAYLNRPTALDGGDPFTPMIRAYAGDMIRIKVQAGGHEEEHNNTIHGVKWLQSGSGHGRSPNSGWRNSQAAGISEQFTFAAPLVPFAGNTSSSADYAYANNSSVDGWWSGEWGIMRTYSGKQKDLFQLPKTSVPLKVGNTTQFNGVCPKTAPVRAFDISAVLANNVLENNVGAGIPSNISPTTNVGGPLNPLGGTLVYNPRRGPLSAGPLHDPTAILYVRTADLDPLTGKLKAGAPVEPLILRANAGDCIEVTLRNKLPGDVNLNGFFDDNPDLPTYGTNMGVVKRQRNLGNTLLGSTTFQNNLIRPSSLVGLHPQLVTYDVTRDDGTVVGRNAPGQQVVPPGVSKLYRWYAGDISSTAAGAGTVNLVATPVEFGGAGILPADKIKQGQKSLVGALSIVPATPALPRDAKGNDLQHLTLEGTKDRQTNTVGALRNTHTMATVGPFRDFVAVFQKKLTMYYGNGEPVEHLNGEGVGIPEDSQENSAMAINYGTEPLWFRFGLLPNAPFGNTPDGFGGVENAHEAYSNELVGDDPVTPIFTASPGQAFRLHAVVPHGTDRGSTFQLHGHIWQRQPYVCPDSSNLGIAGKCKPTEVASRAIGDNKTSFYLGGQESLQPAGHFDFVFPLAGGVNRVPGDYLFRDQASFGNVSGLWGILRVK